MNLNFLNILPSDEEKEKSTEAYTQLYEEGRRFLGLTIENARLLITEKLTLLFGRICLVAVCFVLSACVLIFLSMSISDLLLRNLTPWATYMIVGGFYALLIVIVALFRRSLIVNPIARYLSKVILSPKPEEKRPSAHSTRTEEEQK